MNVGGDPESALNEMHNVMKQSGMTMEAQMVS